MINSKYWNKKYVSPNASTSSIQKAVFIGSCRCRRCRSYMIESRYPERTYYNCDCGYWFVDYTMGAVV